MAEGDSRTISDYTTNGNENDNKKGEKEKNASKHDVNKERIDQSFQVQNYRDYDIYSDFENVLNLNPVSYIDQAKPFQNVVAEQKTFDSKDTQKAPTNSLINNIERIEPPTVSTIVKTAAHIIGPAPPPKSATIVKRRQRKDSSDRNYYEGVALNEEVDILFGDKKTADTRSVSKIYLFI